MIDFHSHILPMMDDGAQNLRESLEMLAMSKQQGVETVVATPHFYPDEDDPESFLRRRSKSFDMLRNGMSRFSPELFPEIRLGAEVLYFDGMSDCSELGMLTAEGSSCLIVEPPMQHWPNYIIDEIEGIWEKQRLIPIIAHIDRYMRLRDDFSLTDAFVGRKILLQINASFLIRPETAGLACDLIYDKRVHFIGSDCHNTDTRPPNMGSAYSTAIDNGIEEEYLRLHSNVKKVLDKYKI